MRQRALVAVGYGLVTLSAHAAQDQPLWVDSPAAQKWTLSAEPGVWYTAPSGKIRLPGGTSTAKTELADLNLDSPRLSPSGELNLRHARWGASLRGYAFAVSDRTPDVPAAAASLGILSGLGPVSGARLSLEVREFEAEGSYRFFVWENTPREEGGFRARSSLDAVVGLRYIEMDWSVAGTASGSPFDRAVSEEFLHPIVGLKFSLDLFEQTTIDAQNTFGFMTGDRESFTWDILLGFQWRPTENFGAQIGYRQVLMRMNDGEDTGFSYEGAMAGIYFGAVFKF